MVAQLLETWKKEISEAETRSKRSSSNAAFKGLHREQAARAAYFMEMADVISNLGLSNPHEKSALSIEPTHPVQSQHIDRAFEKLKINQLLQKTHKNSRLSLISLEMLKRYHPQSDAKRMIEGGLKNPLYLLDPMYGFVFFPRDGQLHNHCLAIDVWTSHLSSMPTQLSTELWKNRADNMLSGGALAGRLLFKDLLPAETDPRKLATTPIMHAESESELMELMGELKSCARSFQNVELWFRGQNKDYLTPERTTLTQLNIAPYSNIRESDFTPSLYRKYDNLIEQKKIFEDFIIELAEWVHFANQILSGANSSDFFQQINGASSINRQGLTSYQRGLILQQYGAPSAYLDITHDENIAAWFATRICNMTGDQKMMYTEYSWNSPDPDEWPTIYVFPLVKGLHPYLDLNSILSGSDAKRPGRQKCGLLGGAGNLARNYCARYLGLKIRLGPNFKLSRPFEPIDLFPSESEDLVLRYLKQSGLNSINRKFPLSELA